MGAIPSGLPEPALTGAQKAAVLCMVLGAEKSVEITRRLSAEEVEAISVEIARFDHVPASVAERVLAEWNEVARVTDSMGLGGVGYAKEILEKSLGESRAKEAFRRVQGELDDSGGLSRLRKADPRQLSASLRGEHPQTIGLILAHLDPAQTAAILRELPTALGSEVIVRMARMEKVSPDMLLLIDRSISSEADLSRAQGMSASGGAEAVAEVMNLMNRAFEKELMDGVAERDPELCAEIRNLMFVFEDLTKLEDRSLQRLLREIDVKVLALAMKVASDELKTKITSGMSRRAVTSLTEEMEYMGPVKLRDVEGAHSEIIAQARLLEEAGEIVIAGTGDDVVIS